jgi:hypothetical protein
MGTNALRAASLFLLLCTSINAKPHIHIKISKVTIARDFKETLYVVGMVALAGSVAYLKSSGNGFQATGSVSVNAKHN